MERRIRWVGLGYKVVEVEVHPGVRAVTLVFEPPYKDVSKPELVQQELAQQ